MSGGVGGDTGGADELQLVEFCLSSGPDGGSTQGAVEQLEEDVFGRPTRHQAVEGGKFAFSIRTAVNWAHSRIMMPVWRLYLPKVPNTIG